MRNPGISNHSNSIVLILTVKYAKFITGIIVCNNLFGSLYKVSIITGRVEVLILYKCSID